MSTQTISKTTSTVSVDVSKASIAATFIFGAVIMLVVGFLPTSAVHNAAHDTRHTAAFPCH